MKNKKFDKHITRIDRSIAKLVKAAGDDKLDSKQWEKLRDMMDVMAGSVGSLTMIGINQDYLSTIPPHRFDPDGSDHPLVSDIIQDMDKRQADQPRRRQADQPSSSTSINEMTKEDDGIVEPD